MGNPHFKLSPDEHVLVSLFRAAAAVFGSDIRDEQQMRAYARENCIDEKSLLENLSKGFRILVRIVCQNPGTDPYLAKFIIVSNELGMDVFEKEKVEELLAQKHPDYTIRDIEKGYQTLLKRVCKLEI
jgi:hypothetical protein